MGSHPSIRAWRPQVGGIVEVLHAHFPEHAYPVHTHDTWTLLIIDDGMVRYDLDRHEHGALPPFVTLLPPHVPHDGRSVTAAGFRKRVLYLDPSCLDPDLVGSAVDHPALPDAVLRDRIHLLHEALRQPGDEFEAESRLALITERLRSQFGAADGVPSRARDRGIALRLRDLLDANLMAGVSLDDAALALGAHPTHLVRAFSREFGMPPHRYLTGRRLDDARRLLLGGESVADVAAAVGFYDQSHLTRHFKRLLGVAPAQYARSGRP
jgi:AraC-like DNA-binding protein